MNLVKDNKNRNLGHKEHVCRICGARGSFQSYLVREMMKGTRDEFEYFVCPECMCLQIAEVPDNLGYYYGTDYYSMKGEESEDITFDSPVTDETKILDMGCGAGKWLLEKAREGYGNLYGCDPFIEEDLRYGDRVYIKKCDISGVTEDGTYDVIRMADSFEHVTNPREVFMNAARLIKDSGRIMMSIPIFPNIAFDMFETHWYQLDAPRHIFLHSIKSMQYLARECGLEIYDFKYDSDISQIVYSFFYQHGITYDEVTRELVIQYFEDREIQQMRDTTDKANQEDYGDHIQIYLRKKPQNPVENTSDKENELNRIKDDCLQIEECRTMNTKEKLKNLLETGDIEGAFDELRANYTSELPQIKEDTDYCIIVASVFLGMQQYQDAFQFIAIGLMNDPKNYELYLLLGEYYSAENIDKALLCYYQSLYYCDTEEDIEVIQSYINDAVQKGAFIRNVSIVVVTRNDRNEIEKCVESIKRTIPLELYELIIVDNASEDGTLEYLETLEDDLCISNVCDEGYVRACNYGIKNSNPDNDILLLDSSAVFTDNAFFYLMLGLYDECVGAISALTNNKSTEQCPVDGDEEAFRKLALMVSVPIINAYENRVSLSDFAMLISRAVLDKVGLLDENFSPFYMEDKDLSLRILNAGYKLRLCYNSFIYCNKDKSDSYIVDDELREINRKELKAKWGFDAVYSSAVRSELLNLIDKDEDSSFEVLELGCAMGNNLNRIEFHWPNSKTYGIEYDSDVVRVAGKTSKIIQGDVENMIIPYEKEKFDYIICADVLEHLRDPEAAVRRFIPYLKDDGYFLVSVPNIRYFGALMSLVLFGRFDYAESGIMDKTHLRFFTRDNAIEMLENAGLEVVAMERNNSYPDDAEEIIDRLSREFDVRDGEEMKVFQYYFLAKKSSN